MHEWTAMPAIHSVLKRLGFVKLRDYGLVLTPEGRILSIRPAVLDDGVGGRIVGWKDDDLAAMELDRWSELGRAMAGQPAPRPAVATPVAVRPSAPPTRAPVAAPTPPAPPVAPPTPQPPVAVASEPVVDEDEWEWTIAIARARAAAEEVASSVKLASRDTQPLDDFDLSDNTKPTAIRIVPAKPAHTPPPLQNPTPTRPLPVVAAPVSVAKAPVVKPPVVAPNRAPVAPNRAPVAPNRTFARGPSPSTIIPIPKLPRVEPGTLAPGVPVRPPTRVAKGTGPVIPPVLSPVVSPVLSPVISRTIVPSNDDKTHPGLLLPPVSRSASR